MTASRVSGYMHTEPVSTTEEISAPWSTITNPKALAAALANASIIASSDESRPVLCCVEMIADPDRLTIVACDSYLLLVQTLIVGREARLDHETGRGEWHALVHRDSLRLMNALLQGVKETPVDLHCGHPDVTPENELEMTVSVNGGPEVPISEWARLAEKVNWADEDPLIAAAAHLVVGTQLGSTSMLQRRLRISYARATRIIADLEVHGIVGPDLPNRARVVLVTPDQLALVGFDSPEMPEPAEGEAAETPSTPQLTNAGELTLQVAESELILPLYDEGVYPNWEQILEHDVGDVDGGRFSAHVVKRLGSLRLPTGEDPVLDWTFSGPNHPVMFRTANGDLDLEMHGAFMPLRES